METATARGGSGPPLPPAVQPAPSMPVSTANSMHAGLSSLRGGELPAGAFTGLQTQELDSMLRQALQMQDQYKRSRDKLLRVVNQQNEDVERLQNEVTAFVNALQVRGTIASSDFV